MKLLAVDDDPIALDLLIAALASSDFKEVVAVGSGQEAIDLLAGTEHVFDAFLLDIRMPGMDGIELCARIKAMPKYRSAPILMITAMAERVHIDGAFAAGAMDYINKPFDPMELGVRVRVAEKLVAQERLVAQSRSELQWMASRNAVEPSFAIDEPINIPEVPRVISMMAMENYLLRLSRLMTFQSESVSFSIVGFDSLYAIASAGEIIDFLSDAAEAIVCGLKNVSHFITYVGNGRFVAVLPRNTLATSPDLMSDVQYHLDLFEPSMHDGRRCPLNLTMGTAYKPSIWAAGEPMNLLAECVTDKDSKPMLEVA